MRDPDASDPDAIDPTRYDAIHRALLTGLLGNLGHKSENSDYAGARGVKFGIFPGSGLFKKGPRWVMAAEIVETTRLYARTCARINSDWVERLASHLVTRTYSDPRWQPATAHVIADEKVSLYGLVLVEKRPVHYGPIDPKISRELFIRHALLEGEYRTSAPFVKHNASLLKEVQALEAKARIHDVLVDDQARLEFYEARVPEGIYNGPLFEKWRREAEQKNPRILLMTRADLMRHGADEITPERFPDVLSVNEMKLPLEYHYEPGPMDGVTLIVPLAALNQMPAARLEWMVPGVLREKIEALIRSLPKALRVKFVPVPDVAKAAAAALQPGNHSLLDALAAFLSKQAGAVIPRSEFDPQSLPDHLKMNFKVVDDAGKQLAIGRDLAEIRRSLGVAARETFANLPQTQSPWHRDNLTRWDFGDLPPQVEVKRDGMTMQGYPALADAGTSVNLRLFDSPEAAADAIRAGLVRLFTLQVREEMRYLERNLPNIEAMSLHFATLGNYKDLKAELLTAIASRALLDETVDPQTIRTPAAFSRIAETGWRRLNPVADEVCAVIADALSTHHEIAKRLSSPAPPALAASVRDVKEQLAHLVPKGFISRTPWPWLRHLPRYLKGIQTRLAKLFNAGLPRDQQNAAIVSPLWQRYLQRSEKHRKEGTRDPHLELYRWMIEELRVSLFAQELKTSIPVSAQRVEKQWMMVKP